MGMSSLVATDTTWGWWEGSGMSKKPRVVSSVTNCSLLSTLSWISDYILVAWENRKTTLASDEKSYGWLNLLKQIWMQWTCSEEEVKGIFIMGGKIKEKLNKSKDIFCIKESGDSYALPVLAVAVQIKYHKSTTCWKICDWDTIKTNKILFIQEWLNRTDTNFSLYSWRMKEVVLKFCS